MNTGSRMESHSERDRITLSREARRALFDQATATPSGLRAPPALAF